MQKLKVASVRRETPEIISLDLVSADGNALASAPPGSHVDVAIGSACSEQGTRSPESRLSNVAL